MNSIDDLDFSKTYTYADYYAWRFEERVELFKGKVNPMGESPGTNHQQVLGNIACQFGNFLKGKETEVLIAPLDIRLVDKGIKDEDITTVVQPDIIVFCDETTLDDRGGIGSPSIVIEILLPGKNVKEINLKFDLYEEFKIKEYWLVRLDEQSLTQYILNNNGKYDGKRPLTAGDKATTPLIPGFELNIDDVFRGFELKYYYSPLQKISLQ
jgi:Uma2 family endonuclease